MSEPMTIVMLSHLASPVGPTGAEHSLALLADGLHRRGHRVGVVHPGPWGLEEWLYQRGVETAEIRTRTHWTVQADRQGAVATAARRLRYSLPDPERSRLATAIAEYRPDVVHVNCLPHLAGAAAAAEQGVPVVWHLREILPPGPRRRWWARKLQRYASRIVAVSEAVASWVREEGLGDRVQVVHNGVDTGQARSVEASRKALGLPPADCIVGLLGQLLPHKGPREFVRAGRLALEKEVDARFIMAGKGPSHFIERVRKDIESHPSSARFHLLPPQPTGAALTAACDVVCLASTSHDPLPRTVLEAMAAGKPVAAFRSGGTPEMVVQGETGLLVEIGDVKALARALVTLAGNPKLRERMGAAAMIRAREQFSLTAHVHRMETVLRSTAGS
ncbi:hypothetical protein ABI59_01395 [Acidobacteria bacterium Mor1]|nr:hypothetical protein ABI59_01395 [Acidobacteria bacterium Mor1]